MYCEFVNSDGIKRRIEEYVHILQSALFYVYTVLVAVCPTSASLTRSKHTVFSDETEQD